MKIALVVHDYHRSGGHSRYVAELASRFAREHEVHVFANRIDEALPPGVRYHHVPAWRKRALTTILTFLLPASRRVNASFDIVHGQGLTLLRQDVITAHICSDAWFKAQRKHQHGLRLSQQVFRLLVTPLEAAVFQPRRSTEVIAISERVRADLRSSYGRAQEVHVIYHGVDLERFAPSQVAQHRRIVRRELGLSDTTFVALYIGDLQKGAAVAIDAVASVPGAHLLLVSRSRVGPYRSVVTSKGILDRISFLAPTTEIERIYAAADVFLFPTFYDAFGMVLTEAMASGLPVITNRAAGAAELIQPGISGIVIDSASEAGQFSDALRELMADSGLRTRLGENARKAAEHLDWDAVAQKTLLVYERALASKHRRAERPLPRIAFVVNGSAASPAGVRAQSFAARLGGDYDIRLVFRSDARVLSMVRFFVRLLFIHPQLIYILDNGYSGIVASAAYKALAKPVTIVDTGDVIYELAKSVGSRGPVRLWLTKQLEALTQRIADRFVVRGTGHKQLLLAEGIQHVAVIQDGVDVEDFKKADAEDLRRKLGLDKSFTVGLLGSVSWIPRHEMAYGWELLELLHLLPDVAVKGILVGDGSGLSHLRRRAKELRLEHRIVFAGAIPYGDVPRYLSVMDVCLSTQSNDLVGQVRTTGKLPLYMAAGRYILATNVGEARLVLPDAMLVPYEGVKDAAYPARLAARIRQLAGDPTVLDQGYGNRNLARIHFDYSVLSKRLALVFDSALGIRPPERRGE